MEIPVLQSELVTIAVYKAFDGQEAHLINLFRIHVPTLREEGLVTDRPVTLMKSEAKGVFIEIFEWTCRDSALRAHENKRVQEIWSRMEQVADFITLDQIEEAQRPFAHFSPVDDIVQ